MRGRHRWSGRGDKHPIVPSPIQLMTSTIGLEESQRDADPSSLPARLSDEGADNE
jgi:hypothetical protein